MRAQLLSVDKGGAVARTRYTVVDGRVHEIPSSIASVNDVKRFFESPITRYLPGAVMRDIFGAISSRYREHCDSDMSVREFFARYFHATVADYAMSAFIHGVYGGDVGKWSMRAQFPQMLALKRRYGSVALGTLVESLKSGRSASAMNVEHVDKDLLRRLQRETFFTFRDGMQALPNALVAYLRTQPDVRLHFGRECVAIDPSTENNGPVKVCIFLKFISVDRCLSHNVR